MLTAAFILLGVSCFGAGFAVARHFDSKYYGRMAACTAVAYFHELMWVPAAIATDILNEKKGVDRGEIADLLADGDFQMRTSRLAVQEAAKPETKSAIYIAALRLNKEVGIEKARKVFGKWL